jgi:hypothetical protein
MFRSTAFLLVPAALLACSLPVPTIAPAGTASGMASPPPPAPRVPDEVDPTFCSSSGGELLPVLDGQWTLEGGERTIWGATAQGTMMMRIGPQDDEDLVFEHMPDAGLMHVTSPDGENEMYMFPATEEQIEAAGALIGRNASRPGCDWYDSPLFIGTNYYYGNEGVQVEDVGQWLPSCTVLAMAGEAIAPERCHSRPAAEDSDFEMEMTLVLRFAGRSLATGMLYFEGELEDDDLGEEAAATISEFRARAAVEVKR